MNSKTIWLTVSAVVAPIVLFVVIALALAVQVAEWPTHYHANFAVFINNAQVNFAKPDFMNLKPCKEDDDPSLHANKRDNVHLHDLIGNVVHLHDSGLTWADLFSNLKFDIDQEAQKSGTQPYFYLNGQQVTASVLNQEIQKSDRLLISYSTEQLPESMQGNILLESQMAQVGENAKDYDQPGKSGESCSGTKKRSLQTRVKIALKRYGL